MSGRPAARRGRWLPDGKIAAVCFSIDDVHPGTSQDPFEAGGDLERGALGRLDRLQARHEVLKVTLCVTPNWRLKSLLPEDEQGTERSHAPARLHESDRFRLDRHPRLVAYLNGLRRSEIVLHGLTHAHSGPRFAVEFQDQSESECAAIVQQGLDIFDAAGLNFVRGYAPPAWNAPAALVAALDALNFEFLCSARDVQTRVDPGAVTAMSGIAGVSLIYPHVLVGRKIVHVTCNFQATSSVERAFEILDLGGVLHIKAHIFKAGGGHVMLDGLDDLYCNYLDTLFAELQSRYGDALWWAHLSEVAARVRLAA